MGQIVSRTFGVVSRQVKMFDIERRAEKVISKEKPDRAPMHASSIKELERLKESNVSTDYITKKDENLDSYLKTVYVTSPDTPPPIKRLENPSRLLPQNRLADSDVSYGYTEEEEQHVPVGRVSLKQALQLLNDHSRDPKTHTDEAIAAQYKLDINTTKDILEHFKIFNVHIKKKKVDPNTLDEFQQLQERVRNMTMMNAQDILNELDSSKNTKLLKRKEEEDNDEPDPKSEKR